MEQAGRVANATKRGAMIGKLVKEISVAAKLGDPHPKTTRASGSRWKRPQTFRPARYIERAVKKGAGLLDEKVTYETVMYEGFAPHKVPVIVECLTEIAIAPPRKFASFLKPARWALPAASPYV